MRKKLTALVLSLALVLELAGCMQAAGDPMRFRTRWDVPAPPAVSSGGTSQEPPSDPDIPDPGAWEEDHVLPIAYTPLGEGKLELPITGATGVTAVELPLWQYQPGTEPDPPEEPEPPAEPDPPAPPEPPAEDPPPPTEEPPAQPEPPPDTSSAPDPDSSAPSGDSSEAPPDTSVSPEQPPDAPDEPAQSDPASPVAGDLAPGMGPFVTIPEPSPDGSQPPDGSQTPAAPDGPQPPVLPPPDASAPPPDSSQTSSSSQASGSAQPPDSSQTPAEPEEPEEPDPYAGAKAVLPAGTCFTILQEVEDWWLVQVEADVRLETEEGQEPKTKRQETTGWVEHRFCMINLPDVIPSILYDATNTYASLFVSSGKKIPGITGEALYAGAVYNPRLDQEQFLMPVLYAMAPRICQAQQAALAQGNCLVIYEAFRPNSTQRAVCRALSTLAKADPEVKAGISTPPWSISWFIATGSSNHQGGYAMDVSLAKIREASLGELYGRTILRVQTYDLYTMPTPIHELSQAAATYTKPVNSYSSTAWKTAQLASTMNQAALALQSYCTGAGLSPLASEWWHFNDLAAYHQTSSNVGKGNFVVENCYSVSPAQAETLASRAADNFVLP